MAGTVTLTFPADTRYVAMARSVAAAMAARADLPLDQLEDARLAVDEAVAQVVADTTDGEDVTCAFTMTGDRIDVLVSAPSRSGQPPPKDTFGWMVLTALAYQVDACVVDQTVRLSLTLRRTLPVEA